MAHMWKEVVFAERLGVLHILACVRVFCEPGPLVDLLLTVYKPRTYTVMYIRTYIHTDCYTGMYIYVSLYTYILVYMYVCIYIRTSAYMYICI